MERIKARIDQTGLSYTEALLATAILGLGLAPALETLDTAFTGASVAETTLQWQQQISSRMEEVLAEPFGNLDAAALAAGNETTPSSYSDAGSDPDRIDVYLSRYDADNADTDNDPFTGADEGILWIRVGFTNAPIELTTLVTQ